MRAEGVEAEKGTGWFLEVANPRVAPFKPLQHYNAVPVVPIVQPVPKPVPDLPIVQNVWFKQFYLVENISYNVSAFSGSADGVENPSDAFWLCSREFSRATNACTRTRHRLGLKVWKITSKFRLAFNQILLFEPNVQVVTDWAVNSPKLALSLANGFKVQCSTV